MVHQCKWLGSELFNDSVKFCFSLNLLKTAKALKRAQRTTKQGGLIG